MSPPPQPPHHLRSARAWPRGTTLPNSVTSTGGGPSVLPPPLQHPYRRGASISWGTRTEQAWLSVSAEERGGPARPGHERHKRGCVRQREQAPPIGPGRTWPARQGLHPPRAGPRGVSSPLTTDVVPPSFPLVSTQSGGPP